MWIGGEESSLCHFDGTTWSDEFPADLQTDAPVTSLWRASEGGRLWIAAGGLYALNDSGFGVVTAPGEAGVIAISGSFQRRTRDRGQRRLVFSQQVLHDATAPLERHDV